MRFVYLPLDSQKLKLAIEKYMKPVRNLELFCDD